MHSGESRQESGVGVFRAVMGYGSEHADGSDYSIDCGGLFVRVGVMVALAP